MNKEQKLFWYIRVKEGLTFGSSTYYTVFLDEKKETGDIFENNGYAHYHCGPFDTFQEALSDIRAKGCKGRPRDLNGNLLKIKELEPEKYFQEEIEKGFGMEMFMPEKDYIVFTKKS